jgi:sulfide:quinone oxidoreductase
VTAHRVVIAGGGVAGLEALIALRALARDRVALTLLAPQYDFVIRALSVEDPFAHPTPRHYPLARISADHGATFRREALRAVRPDAATVTTGSGEEIAYDSLLVAVGAQPQPAFEHVTTFRGLQDVEAMHGLIQDVEGGWSKEIAFVVPSGVTWPLPLYELALMTAERAASVGMEVAITIVTPEEAPLGIFGGAASGAVSDLLRDADIAWHGSAHVGEVRGGVVRGPGGAEIARAQRIVTLPRLTGPVVDGLPTDPDGFIPVDDHGAVRGLGGVFAAGDGTTFPIKQGGIAAQQACAAAHVIAGRAGADVDPKPFRPELHAKLLTGTRAKYLREAVAGGEGDASSTAADESLWWPPTKVAAPYLAPYLEQLDAGAPATG